MKLRNFLYLVLLAILCASLNAIPPPVPSAGVVEREIEREYEQTPFEPDKDIPSIQIDMPSETLDVPDGKKVYIREVVIEGNECISTKEIQSWLEDCVEQELSLKDIYALCQTIDQRYTKKGYFFTRAYPPEQDIEDGVLRIEIIEGKLGNIRIEGNHHYKEKYILGYFKRLQGKPLQYDQFVRALMLLNENSDLKAGAIFEKGTEYGYADVILRVNDARPAHLYFNGNNYGKDLTTNTRLGGRLDWGNLFTNGDKFSVAQVVGFPVNALYFTDGTYTIPLNQNGTSLEAAYLFSKFKIEELKSLNLKGISNIATLKVNQALTRTRSLSIDVFSYFDFKQIQNFVLDSRTSFDKLRVITVGSLLDHFVQGKSRDYLNVRFAAGIPNFLGGLKAVDNNSSRKGGGGRFFKLNADYDHIQHLPWDSFFYFHGSGQASPNKLTIPEQIFIGGIDTVRGFPLAVALGDSGYYINFEFRIPPPLVANKSVFRSNKKWKEIIQFDAFLDHGGTFLRSIQNTYLWGSGLGIRIYGPYSITVSVDVGFPLNHKGLSKGAFTYVKITGQAF